MLRRPLLRPLKDRHLWRRQRNERFGFNWDAPSGPLETRRTFFLGSVDSLVRDGLLCQRWLFVYPIIDLALTLRLMSLRLSNRIIRQPQRSRRGITAYILTSCTEVALQL